jgi:tripartite-type tricarboxylate transporter receptor subunit TctC
MWGEIKWQASLKHDSEKFLLGKETCMKKRLIVGLVLGVALFAFVNMGQTQDKYPSRAIELVVPWGPGGTTTVAARIYSEDLTKVLKVPVNVVNRPGGGGVQGTTYVAKAAKDGYILIQGSGDTHTLAPNLSKEVTYDPIKDFTPLAYFSSIPIVFTVRTESPFKTFGELIDYAKKNPGKLKNGASGVGTEGEFNLEIISMREKYKIVTIPFDGGGQSIAGILGGHVDMSSNQISQMIPHIKAGKLRGLAVTSKTRHPEFPDIPTTTELGYPEANIQMWNGVFGPAGLPQPVVSVLVDALEKSFKNPEVIQRAQKAGFSVDYKGPEELSKFLETELRMIEKVAKDTNQYRK